MGVLGDILGDVLRDVLVDPAAFLSVLSLGVLASAYPLGLAVAWITPCLRGWHSRDDDQRNVYSCTWWLQRCQSESMNT